MKLVDLYRKEHPNFLVKYITNNGNLDIWEDLKIQIIGNKNYIIVLDDANKLKTNLELIINFLKTERLGKIKLILTVRSYLQNEVNRYLDYFDLIEIKNFNREELGNILQSPDFNINKYYVDRIFSISKGNPRIAIMAALAGLNI